jgi:hypothetical protein
LFAGKNTRGSRTHKQNTKKSQTQNKAQDYNSTSQAQNFNARRKLCNVWAKNEFESDGAAMSTPGPFTKQKKAFRGIALLRDDVNTF